MAANSSSAVISSPVNEGSSRLESPAKINRLSPNPVLTLNARRPRDSSVPDQIRSEPQYNGEMIFHKGALESPGRFEFRRKLCELQSCTGSGAESFPSTVNTVDETVDRFFGVYSPSTTATSPSANQSSKSDAERDSGSMKDPKDFSLAERRRAEDLTLSGAAAAAESIASAAAASVLKSPTVTSNSKIKTRIKSTDLITAGRTTQEELERTVFSSSNDSRSHSVSSDHGGHQAVSLAVPLTSASMPLPSTTSSSFIPSRDMVQLQRQRENNSNGSSSNSNNNNGRNSNRSNSNSKSKSICSGSGSGNKTNSSSSKINNRRPGHRVSNAQRPPIERNRKCFVGNLDWHATEANVIDFFSQFGQVSSAKVR